MISAYINKLYCLLKSGMEDGDYITGVFTPRIQVLFPKKQFSNVVGHHIVVFHDGTSTLTP